MELHTLRVLIHAVVPVCLGLNQRRLWSNHTQFGVEMVSIGRRKRRGDVETEFESERG
jgi:hypothetical protein